MRMGHGTCVRLAAFLTGAVLLQGCGAAEPVEVQVALQAQAPDAEAGPGRVYAHMIPPPGHGHYTGTVADWPLWFPWHYFGSHCFSVQECTVDYARLPNAGGTSRPSFESLGRPVEKVLRAGSGPVRNFPPPAKVTWRSQDGTPLTASVDMAEIFADRMVRHPVPREDILENSYIPYPGIILVVDDRTISVYMRTWIPLKELRDPDNPYSNQKTSVELVHSRTY